MAQIFSPRSGLYARLALLGAAGGILGVIFLFRTMTAEPHGIDEAVEQTVPFSHRHHAGQLGIDCRYCHVSVETGANAGFPAVSTCMTCHSQLYTDQTMLAPVVQSWLGARTLVWQRVYDLPDFVYFNHSVHIARGFDCAACHGDVEHMPLMRRKVSLSMSWCLDCHRSHDATPAHRLSDCSVCHR